MFLRVEDYWVHSTIHSIVIVDSDFSFTVKWYYTDQIPEPFSNTPFFQKFVDEYEDRGIDPLPELIRYWQKYNYDGFNTKLYSDYVEYVFPQFKERFDKLMILM